MATLKTYALTTVADVKELLDIPSSVTKYDNLIIRKINQATAAIEAWCGRRFKATDYTDEIYNGSRGNQLVLKQRPIISGLSIKRRDTALNESDFDTVDTELYFADNSSGVIDLLFGTGWGWGSFAISYRAGYETIPDDLAEACATLAAYYVQNASADVGVTSKREGQRQVTYNSKGISGGVDLLRQLGIDDIINSYSNIALFADK